jgi:hypothetical protein
MSDEKKVKDLKDEELDKVSGGQNPDYIIERTPVTPPHGRVHTPVPPGPVRPEPPGKITPL